TCVTAGAAFGVEITHHGADIGFQQTGTYGNEYQAEEKGRIARHGHAEMSGGNDAAAHEDRLSLPPDVIGYPASGQGQKINRGGVQTVNGRCIGDSQSHSRITAEQWGGHKKHEQGAHPRSEERRVGKEWRSR